MRYLASVLGLLAGLALAPVLAQDTRTDGIEGTIRSQIDAFIADDFATAFTFASPMIKGVFGNSDNFGRMVREGYPMVWRPSDVRFLERKEIGGRQVQRVLLVDRAGVAYVAEYEMIQTADGWQINGVSIEKSPEVGA